MTTTLPPILADDLPPKLPHLQRIMRHMSDTLAHSGFIPVTTPLVEQADLFLIKAGDAAINRLVSFELAGQTLCLRPEFTAPAARAYIEHFQMQQGPVRLQFSGPILQYENLRHGEITQRQAVGAELINDSHVSADAEIIGLTSKLLAHAGIQDWTLVIGHSGLINRFLDRYNLNRQMRRFVLDILPVLTTQESSLEQIESTLDQLLSPSVPEFAENVSATADSELALQALMNATPQRGPSGGRTREEIARRLLEKQSHSDHRNSTLQAIKELRDVLTHAATPAALLDYFQGDALEPLATGIVDTFTLLETYGIPSDRITFDLAFTRNLDYYTGIVFEFRTSMTTGNELLGGGGRYDELIGLLGAQQHVPAVGFMLYTDTHLAEAKTDKPEAVSPSSFIITAEHAKDFATAITVANDLRAQGCTVITHLSDQDLPDQTSTIVSVRQDNTLQISVPTKSDPIVIPSTNAQILLETVENFS